MTFSIGNREIDGLFITDFLATNPHLHQRPLGAYHLSRVLESRGLRCQVIDFFFSFNEKELEKIIEMFVSKNTKFIGISTTFTFNWANSDNLDKSLNGLNQVGFLIKKVKEINPRILVIQGGSSYFEKHPLVDVQIVGQYVENQFLSVLEKNCAIKINSKYDFNISSFKYEPHDFILMNETLPVEISRGCIFSCKFCSFAGRGKKKGDYIKSSELIANTLLDSYQKFESKNFFLADDTFNESVSKIRALNLSIKKLPFKPKLCGFLRIDLLIRYPEMLGILDEMGVQGINFGIETFNKNAAISIGKGLNSEIIKKFLYQIKKEYPHWYISSGFIVGLPNENVESVYQTNEWLIKEAILDSWVFYPLCIDNRQTSGSVSYFSENIEKYGYERVGNFGWKRDDLSFEDAQRHAQIMNSNASQYSGPSPWTLFNLLRIHPFDLIRTVKLNQLQSYLDFSKFTDYKNKLGIF